MYQWILIKLHLNVRHNNISSKFSFQVAGLKVKVIVAIFRKKTLSLLYPLQLSMDFNISSHSCWVLKYLSKFNFPVNGLKVTLTVAPFQKTKMFCLRSSD